ncbi:methylated-DNA--[protein]-cysteine S-methyltransferase [Modicisalibacter tunisiensis]|uniref:methylated-DNA--[protein]-cysteine S-methyltransferase n=1 Tax=Modicisalibacter tunisiensis TaxID=390637 RepID=UPI001CCA2066|nr:methylated-DNA--[protein]-cysteine S-methyltransferase [Modicisalibacter tunisiensis]MBZ9539261.1 methylated-DNA--[protein]-cysteine S-methyltransferase [Modicisalibacter tunisiensis]
MRFTTFSSPFGELLLAGDDAGLRHLSFDIERIEAGWERDDAALTRARDEVLGYLAGRRRQFSVDIAPVGGEAQRAVWAAVRRIPYGTTRTYGELARRLGDDVAVISVTRAVAANPLPLLVPCHRLVTAGGPGSWPGGVALKRRLLALEAGDAAAR